MSTRRDRLIGFIVGLVAAHFFYEYRAGLVLPITSTPVNTSAEVSDDTVRIAELPSNCELHARSGAASSCSRPDHIATPAFINYSGFGLTLPPRNTSVPPNEDYSELRIPFDVKGCRKIFLDLGSNSGVQLRKLYNRLNPQSPIGSMFSFHFDGDERNFPGGEGISEKSEALHSRAVDRFRDVCVIAFEPDEAHHAGLRRLTDSLREGHPEIRLAVIFAPVWINNDLMPFFRKKLSKGSSFDGAVRGVDRRIGQRNVALQHVRAFDLVQFALSLPLEARVLVKMDVEGAEHRLLQDLVTTGALCHFDVVMIETHDHAMVGDRTALSNPEIMGMILRRSPCTCKTQFLDLDDETE